MIVLDASAAIEILLQTPAGSPVTEELLLSEEAFHAPHLFEVEVAQVLRRLCSLGEITDRRATQALADLADLPVERYAHDLLLPRAWELRHNLTLYDAVYVTLAELLPATLLTRDTRIEKAPGHRARVRVF